MNFLPLPLGEDKRRGFFIFRTNPNSTDNAKALRENSTKEEQKLWKYLKAKRLGGFKFRRQEPIGKYFVDFICFETKLIIELDGGHHNDAYKKEYDFKRTQFLESCGFRIVRFWNNQIDNEMEKVLNYILQECRNRSPLLNPFPQGEEIK